MGAMIGRSPGTGKEVLVRRDRTPVKMMSLNHKRNKEELKHEVLCPHKP